MEFGLGLESLIRTLTPNPDQVHPSPVNSRFSRGGGNDITLRKVSAMDFFYKFATGPEALPDLFFRAVSLRARVRVRDRV